MKQIELRDVEKIYETGDMKVHAVCGINLTVEKGEMVAIMGPSGSGKSTLMHIIGLLDRPTSGELFIKEEKIDMKMADRKLARLRSKTIGFVFQQFNLLPRISAMANVLMPTTYVKGSKKAFEKKAHDLLKRVGLDGRERHKSSELSGGEIQRVAIARALVNDPDIVLADEPTGNLDSKSGGEVMKVLKDLNKEGKTVVVITHDPKIAEHAQKTIHLLDGKIAEETK